MLYDEAVEIAQRAGVVLGRGRMAKVLGPQEPFDELRVSCLTLYGLSVSR